MKKSITCVLSFIFCLILSSSALSQPLHTDATGVLSDDLDPLVDVSVTVRILQIRTLEAKNLQMFPYSKIDRFSDPDFYVKVIINENNFTSPVWKNTKYVYSPNWSATLNVPDTEELVNITIQLWDQNPGKDRLCDIGGTSEERPKSSDIQLQYSIATGHWSGDDYVGEFFWGGTDPSGYGRANGCDDNSMYQDDRDCELLFDITQNDYDGDGAPYWTEVNMFHTDPMVSNLGEDIDHDGVPFQWEFKWGYALGFRHHHEGQNESFEFVYNWSYSPLRWENHSALDPDNDGLSNYEEYLTSQWGSDPFRQDLFIEMDQMKAGPNGEPASIFPEGAKELLRTAYNKQNIVYHLDDGSWAGTGSEMIPFDNLTESSWGFDDENTTNELQQTYQYYFLHNDTNNWRRGVFHYGVVLYQCSIANGNAFGGGAFQISYKGLSNKTKFNRDRKNDIVFASAYMHETGHTLAIQNPAVDNSNSKFMYQVGWWQWRHYKSVMNYGYMFTMVDYSDGSRGNNDFDDWQTLDLAAFQRGFW